ncbi:efflux RND transporter permease subunit [Allopusillimonas ginsengisoli]|uniref:efflux RND transporter permease subunit n=1 Tax=Allopusillimonas ginsengisoli TaxID=453575 RepID=UPI00101F09A0|nr:efflux RND transporter permease subunit [Allopusillimonas ginsengisoli]TEA77796.1 efflux RND transporter permease subunit [Allopusillimonas ginsengisoli]
MSARSQEERATGFNLSRWAIAHRALMVYFILMLTIAGALAGLRLAQSEDPPFTFRVMVIQTMWPGATAQQVQEEVTNRIERTLQEMSRRDYTRSYSRPGESTIFYFMEESAPADKVSDEWYQIRKKIGDVAATLPAGVHGPFFNDEFGDVYTNIFALKGDGFSPAQLRDQADTLRNVLLRVPGVAKVDYFGDQEERIEIRIPNAVLAQSGLSPARIGQAIAAQNAVADPGVVTTAHDRVFVRPTGQFNHLEAVADTLLQVDGKVVRLGDIARISRGYVDPPSTQMRFQGQPVLGIGVTASEGYDVVRLGQNLGSVVTELKASLPVGLALEEVSSMPLAVSASVDEFLRSVGEAIAIVLLVSLVSLGLRTGMIVVISIPVVLALTALFMYWLGIGLHKVSLGTLILSLGLLVDDAIIAVEMMAVKLEQGWDRVRAAAFAYTSTAFPMMTGTLVTVAGFLPIALAESSTGEYTRSIFEVSAIALLVSWLAAVILIPLLGYALLKPRPLPTGHAAAQANHEVDEHDIYNSRFYTRLRRWLRWCVGRRVLVLALTGVLFVVAMSGFGLIPKQFFPDSARPELLVDLRLRESASFSATLEQAERLEKLLDQRAEIDHFFSFVGTGAPRFYLPLDQQLPSPNFAQFVVTAKSIEDREALKLWLDPVLQDQFPALRGRVSRLESGPPVGFPVQFRVSGDDIPTVRKLAEQVANVMRNDGRAIDVQFDWDEPSARGSRFVVDHQAAQRLGVSSRDIADFLAMTLSGYTVSQYREADKLIRIDLRAPDTERGDPARLMNLALPTPNGPVPLGALGHMEEGMEYAIIWEYDRQPTITVRADVKPGVQGIDLTEAVDSKLADLRANLPVGYHIDVGGSVEGSGKAQASIVAKMPFLVVAVLTLLMIQLQSFSRVMLVVVTAPLGLIGVVATLLLFGKPFGFVAMLGVIAMFGIIMRNSVILVDQIEQDIAAGHKRFDAVVDATVRRFRPITLTAAAAVLGLIPLLRSDFFGPMATALMGGITSATILTVFVLPALYALMFRVRTDETAEAQNQAGQSS